MIIAERTLSLIDRAIENNQEDSHRTHLGASLLGSECARKLYYIWRWVLAERHSGRLLRLFSRGDLEEIRLVEYLRQAGIEVWENDNDGNQFRISHSNGHLGGSKDGIARGVPEVPEDALVLLEFKTHNDKYFKELVRKGVHKAQPKHYTQMQTYMRKSPYNLEYGLYTAVNKNTDHIHTEIINLDKAHADLYLNRGDRIINATEPPPRINNNPTWYKCKWCAFRLICHHGVPAEINCRTCVYSKPIENKQWRCSLYNTILDKNIVKTGCQSHVFIPQLVGADKAIQTQSGQIKLTIKDQEYLQGQGGVTSHDLRQQLIANNPFAGTNK